MTVDRRRRPVRLVVIGVLLVGVLVVAAGAWYILFRPAGPPPVGTSAPIIPAGAISATAAPSVPSATGPGSAAPSSLAP